jgi:hypothetical protein
MATIIEVQDSKVEHLAEYAEKVMKYGKKMMECLEEMSEKGSYSDRYRGSYSDRYGNRYGSEKHKPERDEEYGRYY